MSNERERTPGHNLALDLIDKLRRNLTIAKAERDDALWEIERIREWTHATNKINWAREALREILKICERALAGSKRIKEDE